MSGGGIASDLLRGVEIPDGLLRDLPKAELHLHLDGSLRLATYLELAQAQGQELPGGSAEAAAAHFAGEEGEHGLDAYIGLFDHTVAVLQDADSLRRVAREAVEDCAAENCVHVELRFAPTQHGRGGLDARAATRAVLDGLAEAARATGTSTGLILTALRHRPTEEGLEVAKLAVSFKGEGVVGFDLAGREAGAPARHHREAFYEILNHNMNCTVHAGEEWGPESIHEAVHYLGAHRISHALRLLEDPELAAFVADHRIPLELGLGSAARTGAVAGVDHHPLRAMLRQGLRCTLTTNNRLFTGNTLSDEYRLAADTFDLTLLELENLVISSIKSAFLPQATRKALLKRCIGSFPELRRRHGLEGGDQ